MLVTQEMLLRRLHVGLNNTSTGLRLKAWPTAGIILTTIQNQVTDAFSQEKKIDMIKRVQGNYSKKSEEII